MIFEVRKSFKENLTEIRRNLEIWVYFRNLKDFQGSKEFQIKSNRGSKHFRDLGVFRDLKVFEVRRSFKANLIEFRMIFETGCILEI